MRSRSPSQGHARPAGLPPGDGQVQEFTSAKTAALRFASPCFVRVLTCVYTVAMTCGAHPFLARTYGAKNAAVPAAGCRFNQGGRRTGLRELTGLSPLDDDDDDGRGGEFIRDHFAPAAVPCNTCYPHMTDTSLCSRPLILQAFEIII